MSFAPVVRDGGDDKSLRVLFVLPKGSRAGSMSFALRLAAALQHEGAQIETVFVRTLFRPWVFVWQGNLIWRLARSGRFDVVHAQYGTYTGLITVLFASFSKCPVVVTFRGSDLNPVPSENKAKWCSQHLSSQAAAWLADGVICVSAQLRSRVWFSKRRSAVISSGTDLDMFRPLSQAECRLKM